ncbi:2-amino-4-hydroxy-6-hydroxymethyldihydropteridine diphosphokinase [Desulfovibrio sp. OttesenSCG-928-G15]|nr:2-amino-4-hydroxy-6-hydroxymethyldihydropteridine diphosphokinase [Desulfovibrio sp. OttesenSCG-928-G15]
MHNLAIPPDALCAYIGLGSNTGDSVRTLAAAVGALARLPDTLPGVLGLVSVSGLYRTEPQGVKDQPFFLNQVACLACAPSLSANSLLDALLILEQKLGRVREGAVRFGPRAIDLDLLLFGNTSMNDERLTLPHPRMCERAFVLVPLLEIAPDLALPDGRAVAGFLSGLGHACRDGVIYQP